MEIKTFILALSLLSSVTYAQEKMNCKTEQECELAAVYCGNIAGAKDGKKMCEESGYTDPDLNLEWPIEVKSTQCMGELPIKTLFNENLKSKYTTAFKQSFDKAYTEAGCKQ